MFGEGFRNPPVPFSVLSEGRALQLSDAGLDNWELITRRDWERALEGIAS